MVEVTGNLFPVSFGIEGQWSIIAEVCNVWVNTSNSTVQTPLPS